MKKYLRELEMAGILLLAIGIVLSFVINVVYGAWPCGVGLLLMLAVIIYKAFHWKEYERENRQYIFIMLAAIILLFLQMVLMRN